MRSAERVQHVDQREDQLAERCVGEGRLELHPARRQHEELRRSGPGGRAQQRGLAGARLPEEHERLPALGQPPDQRGEDLELGVPALERHDG
jgi:hypothetical protein